MVEKALEQFDEVHVVVLINPDKKTVLSADKRVKLIETSVRRLGGKVQVAYYEGLAIDYCKENEIDTLVRGIRSSADVEYELQMAHMNRELNPEIETIILPTKVEHSFVSSSLVKEVVTVGGDVKNLVPKTV